ncbi:hypothetical protein B0H14DRAFT_1188791 [Mycena olivaceomarginata]|nr:hypothetical protein B0H14DRAFT_1188791 [Mycena olivaceomarginata]
MNRICSSSNDRIMDNFSRYAFSSESYSVDNAISLTPATPPTGATGPELHDADMVGVRTPVSECGSSGSGYSPALSDASYHSQPECLYTSGSSSDHQPLPFSSPSPLRMFGQLSVADHKLSPEMPPTLHSPYAQYPPSNSGGTISPTFPLDETRLGPENHYPPSLSPTIPLLTFSDYDRWAPSFEDNSDAFSPLSPLEHGPRPLLFDTAPPLPRLVLHSEADHSTFGSQSRTQSDMMVVTEACNDRLAAPPRRHSFNTHRPDATFFLSQESGLSTPDTPSSPFPSSPSSSNGATPDLPPSQPQVASPAGVHAANLRRKRPPKFQCDDCQATFTTKHNWKNHLNSHRGIRPHTCGLCGLTFTTSAVKKRHEKNQVCVKQSASVFEY